MFLESVDPYDLWAYANSIGGGLFIVLVYFGMQSSREDMFPAPDYNHIVRLTVGFRTVPWAIVITLALLAETTSLIYYFRSILAETQ